MMTDPKSGWTWLADYINQVVTTQGTSAITTETLWRTNIGAFFACNKADKWPYSADFSTAGKPEKWGPAYQKAHGGSTTTTTKEITLPTSIVGVDYEIPTPVKDNDEFIGWYDNNEGRGDALAVLPVGYDGTVYAIWKSSPTSVENIRPALDMNAPMYDIMGRQVDKTYRGIIIQNGNKYLLR